MRTSRISEKDRRRMVKLYVEEGFTLQAIGDLFGLTRPWVRKILNSVGVDTSRSGPNVLREVSCEVCGRRFSMTRCVWRSRRFRFCSAECRKAWVDAGSLKRNRMNHLAEWKLRMLMGAPLPEGSVVHHRNGDPTDNSPGNLMLFASQEDHVKWHRGLREGIEPLWKKD